MLEGPGHEKRLQHLQRKFRRANFRMPRLWRGRSSRFRILALTVSIPLVGLGIATIAFSMLFRSFDLGWRHVVAAWDCDAAHLVGFAPALRGEPGYWDSHDADQDGTSCEFFPDGGWEVRYFWL
jgi:hypothetical protein